MATLMHFLGVGIFELAITLIVAVLVVGPDSLARSLVGVSEHIRNGDP